MFNFKKKFQGEKNLALHNIRTNHELFTDLLEVLSYLLPTKDEHEVFLIAHMKLLEVTDTKLLKHLVKEATECAIEKAKEVSVLESSFNSPASETNNN